MSAVLRQRLAEAMAVTPVHIGRRLGHDLFARGDLVLAVPAVPAGAPSWTVATIEAARSALLAGRCSACGAEPHLTRRWGLRVWHHTTCPASILNPPATRGSTTHA